MKSSCHPRKGGNLARIEEDSCVRRNDSDLQGCHPRKGMSPSFFSMLSFPRKRESSPLSMDSVIVKKDEAAPAIFISGELTFSSIMKVWTESLPYLQNTSQLEIDLSRVTLCNSAGLALLMEWYRFAKQHKILIRFTQVPTQLMSIAPLSGVDKLLKDATM